MYFELMPIAEDKLTHASEIVKKAEESKEKKFKWCKQGIHTKSYKIKTIRNSITSFEDWTAFQDMLVSLVHEYNELIKIRKLHYLKTFLYDVALKIKKIWKRWKLINLIN